VLVETNINAADSDADAAVGNDGGERFDGPGFSPLGSFAVPVGMARGSPQTLGATRLGDPEHTAGPGRV